ncbi:potassium channel family protein [uncultured Enterococcus sp.]|uniref:potassium channel family protein n=1 Tax=uncultured Enterococcus sp. TaxID=167972 RepID=UPI002AA899A1|nr:potassium channel family protein [uncultured Enterococcus sp.]
MKIFKNKNYEFSIIILSILSIFLVVLDFSSVINISQQPYLLIDTVILIIFTIDYIARFFLAEEKKKFFLTNIFDLIAIIPFSSIFSFFRVARIFRIARISRISRLSRLVGITGKLSRNLNGFLKTNGFINVLYISVVLILISATTYSVAENVPFVDSLWWALVTTTTVGYGDISPTSPFGRIAAIILMFLGIGFIGLLTSTITEFFNGEESQSEESKDELLQKIDYLIEKVENLEKKIDEKNQS